MSIIFNIMKEEYERLCEAQKAYKKSAENEVQGAPRIKHIGKKDYLYLERRNGKRVLYKYVGAANSKKALEVIDSVKRRRKDIEALRRIRKDLKDIRKVLRGKI